MTYLVVGKLIALSLTMIHATLLVFYEGWRAWRPSQLAEGKRIVTAVLLLVWIPLCCGPAVYAGIELYELSVYKGEAHRPDVNRFRESVACV